MAALQIDDVPDAIRQAKRTLRAQLPNYREVYEEVAQSIGEQARHIARLREAGEAVIPELAFADIAAQRVSAETIGRALDIAPTADEKPLAPGMLSSHYAPKARLRLNASEAEPGEALLAFGAAPASDALTLNLSPRGDLIEAATNLFSHLRALDASGAKTVAVMRVPRKGLGEAINDRLARAAAPRQGRAE